MNLIVQRLLDEPWAITPAALEVILGVAAREIDLAAQISSGIPIDKLFHTSALNARPGARLEGTQRGQMRNGIAVLPVYGPMFPRANLMTQVSGATSTETLTQDFMVALNNPDVRGILFDIDSPGGAVTGIAEASDAVYNARGRKPVMSYISGLGASAAFWFGSATERIMAAQTAEVGSVGVVAAYRDTRGAEEKAGIRNVEVVSSISPLKRASIDSDEGRAKIQRIVDAVADVFVSHLARNRRVEAQQVLDSFGKGDLFVGERAVAAGMIDQVMTFEQALLTIEAECGTSKYKEKRKRKEMSMADKQEQVTMTAEAVREAFPEAAEELFNQGKTEGAKNAAETERARIQSIMALSAPGNEKIIQEAIADSTMTAEKTALKVLQEQQKRGQEAGNKIQQDAQALAAQAAGLGAAAAPGQGSSEDEERKAKAERMAHGGNSRRAQS